MSAIENLCNQIKQMQRQDPDTKAQWNEYCNAAGNGIRDPSKHDPIFVETFIVNFNAGMRFEANDKAHKDDTYGAQAPRELIELFKVGQRKSPSWRQAWAHYCHIWGNSKNDPAKHSEAFLVGFMDMVSGRGLNALSTGINLDVGPVGSQSMIMGSVSTPDSQMALQDKQQQIQSTMQALTAMGGAAADPNAIAAMGAVPGVDMSAMMQQQQQDQQNAQQTQMQSQMAAETVSAYTQIILQQQQHLEQLQLQQQQMQYQMQIQAEESATKKGRFEPNICSPVDKKDLLVARIKAFQRSAEDNRQHWWAYADSILRGIRDPARHDCDTLQLFIDSYHVR